MQTVRPWLPGDRTAPLRLGKGTTTVRASRPFLPDRKRLDGYIDRVYQTAWLTNDGPLVRELETRLAQHLGIQHVLLVANGTLALQIAYRVLGITGSVITTPFSFVATASSLVWEGLRPVFADIDPATLNLDPANLAAAHTETVSGIVPVHVFGNPCEVATIDRYAAEAGLKVIYDGAHAFGVEHGGRSLVASGDATILSFHATKLFHTIEGGAVVFADAAAQAEARQMINFGIDGEDSVGSLGINAKMNEFEAAMGLAVLEEIDTITAARRRINQIYSDRLRGTVGFQQRSPDATDNHAYFPILLEDNAEMDAVRVSLLAIGAQARRYFHPSLDTLPYVDSPPMPHSRHSAASILCLPIYPALRDSEAALIADTVAQTVGERRRIGAKGCR